MTLGFAQNRRQNAKKKQTNVPKENKEKKFCTAKVEKKTKIQEKVKITVKKKDILGFLSVHRFVALRH